jgi:hypothetical protein
MDINEWRQSVTADYLTMARAPRDRLRWTTLILAVRVVRISDDPSAEVIRIIQQLPDELRACAMLSGYLKRGTRWAGVVEIDLVHPRLLGGAAKRELIGVLAGIDPDTLTADQRLIIVHLHAVVDSKGHARPDKLADDLRKCWPGPRRVHSASIWTDGTVAENLERLASYSTKLWNHYSEAWEGRATRRLMAREPEWTAWMHRLHDAIGLPNMVVSSVSSRAAKCPRNDDENLAPQGFDENPEGPQFTAPADHEDDPQEPLIKTLMQAIMAKEKNALPPSEDLPHTPTTTTDPSLRGHAAQDAGGHSRPGTGDRAPGAAEPRDGAGPVDRGEADQGAHSGAVDEEGGCGSRTAAEDQGHPGIGEQAGRRHQSQDRLNLP